MRTRPFKAFLLSRPPRPLQLHDRIFRGNGGGGHVVICLLGHLKIPNFSWIFVGVRRLPHIMQEPSSSSTKTSWSLGIFLSVSTTASVPNSWVLGPSEKCSGVETASSIWNSASEREDFLGQKAIKVLSDKSKVLLLWLLELGLSSWRGAALLVESNEVPFVKAGLVRWSVSWAQPDFA